MMQRVQKIICASVVILLQMCPVWSSGKCHSERYTESGCCQTGTQTFSWFHYASHQFCTPIHKAHCHWQVIQVASYENTSSSRELSLGLETQFSVQWPPMPTNDLNDIWYARWSPDAFLKFMFQNDNLDRSRNFRAVRVHSHWQCSSLTALAVISWEFSTDNCLVIMLLF